MPKEQMSNSTGASEAGNAKKGRFKRLTFSIPILAAVILTVICYILPKVPPASLASSAILIAIIVAFVINFFYERIKR